MKHKLVDFIIEFQEEVDKEISEMKLFVRGPPSLRSPGPRRVKIDRFVLYTDLGLLCLQLNARARFVAESFLTPVSIPPVASQPAFCLHQLTLSSLINVAINFVLLRWNVPC